MEINFLHNEKKKLNDLHLKNVYNKEIKLSKEYYQIYFEICETDMKKKHGWDSEI